jgi:proteasome lid subunit RPN8/RPN11
MIVSGWASVKYKGRKMDQFKTIWAKMKAKKEADDEILNEAAASMDNDEKDGILPQNGHMQAPVILRHNQLAPKHPSDLTNILLDVDSFQSLGKIQPFTLSISSSALLVLDLHSHMVREPVCGYLAGQWDLNAHNLAITHTFPCLTSTKDPEEAHKTEADIYSQMYTRHLTLVGWYRSTPGMPALPSLKDSEAQLDYQLKLLGNSDSTYSPCVGLMTSPFTSGANESTLLAYWVVPPPDTIPVEYGRPLKMTYSLVTDPCLSQETLNLLTTVLLYYKTHQNRVVFADQYNSDTKFITKMGRTLLPKFPRDQDERLWRYIRMLILGDSDSDIDDPLLIRPPLPNGINGSLTATNNPSRRNSSRRQTNDEDEEEIDDDEENALMNVRNGSDMSTPPVPTEDVISMLLQRQAPISSGMTGTESSKHEVALDFSASKQQQSDESS